MLFARQIGNHFVYCCSANEQTQSQRRRRPKATIIRPTGLPAGSYRRSSAHSSSAGGGYQSSLADGVCPGALIVRNWLYRLAWQLEPASQSVSQSVR